MSPELEQRLYDEFPNLFVRRRLPPTISCMHFGLNVGDGWFDVVRDLCLSLSGVDPPIVFEQIKEKFGLLRVYYVAAGELDGVPVKINYDLIDGLILEAEDKSSRTCERCGAVGSRRNDHGYLLVECDECYK